MLGIIDATTSFGGLQELTMVRSLAAVPYGGRYRLIDFALSNLVNSDVQSVAIFPKYQYRSLMDHLGSGKDWDLNRKRDGLFFFPPPFNTDKDHLASVFHYMKFHKDYFYRSTQEYAVIVGSNTICNLNYKNVLKEHIETGADITRIFKGGRPLNMCILKTSLLMELIESPNNDPNSTLSDILDRFARKLNVHHYEFSGYAVTIDTIQCYYKHSLDLLQPAIMKELFNPDNPIFTKVKDEPPTRYMSEAMVRNAQIANGSIIEGHVENSIIFRGVKIGKDAVVKNSIIMQKSQIEAGAYVDGAIIDKDVIIKKDVVITGDASSPVVIQKGSSIQGELMSS